VKALNGIEWNNISHKLLPTASSEHLLRLYELSGRVGVFKMTDGNNKSRALWFSMRFIVNENDLSVSDVKVQLPSAAGVDAHMLNLVKV